MKPNCRKCDCYGYEYKGVCSISDSKPFINKNGNCPYFSIKKLYYKAKIKAMKELK